MRTSVIKHIKCLVIFVTVITIYNNKALAQPDSLFEPPKQSLTSVTLKAGPIRSDIYSFEKDELNDVHIESKRGFSAGMSLCLGISQVFAIQPEIMYSIKGAKALKLDGGITREQYDLELHYVEVPILFKFVAPIGGAVRGNIYFGPFGALNVENKSRLHRVITGTNTVVSDEVPTEFNVNFIPFDAGGILGGGMSFRLLGTELMFDARCSLSAVPLTEDGEVHNRTFSLMLGITF